MSSKKYNVIEDKSFKFAVRIVNLYKYLISEKKEFVLSKQILKYGTSIGANTEEALGGVSNSDFSNKLSIAYKEARETLYWLRLLNATDYLEVKVFQSMFNDCDEICKILFTIIRKTK